MMADTINHSLAASVPAPHLLSQAAVIATSNNQKHVYIYYIYTVSMLRAIQTKDANIEMRDAHFVHAFVVFAKQKSDGQLTTTRKMLSAITITEVPSATLIKILQIVFHR